MLATKFGFVSHASGGPGVLDSSPANIRTAVEGSLQRLGTDHIDLYYQHRVDPNTPIEDTVGALAELIARARSATSACPRASPATIRRAHAVHPVTAVQTEYSLWTRDVEAEILPLLRQLNIGFVPYSPLGHGFLTGQIRSTDDIADDDWRKTNPRFTGENFQRNLRIVDEVEAPSPPRPMPPRHRPPLPGCSPRATTSPRSPAPSGWPASRRTPPPTPSSSAPSRSNGSTTSPRPLVSATRKGPWPPSSADARAPDAIDTGASPQFPLLHPSLAHSHAV